MNHEVLMKNYVISEHLRSLKRSTVFPWSLFFWGRTLTVLFLHPSVTWESAGIKDTSYLEPTFPQVPEAPEFPAQKVLTCYPGPLQASSRDCPAEMDHATVSTWGGPGGWQLFLWGIDKYPELRLEREGESLVGWGLLLLKASIFRHRNLNLHILN